MPTCVVPKCGSRNEYGWTLFRFPRDKESQAKWCERLGLCLSSIKQNTSICQLHFDDNDLRTQGNSYRLRAGCLPLPQTVIMLKKREERERSLSPSANSPPNLTSVVEHLGKPKLIRKKPTLELMKRPERMILQSDIASKRTRSLLANSICRTAATAEEACVSTSHQNTVTKQQRSQKVAEELLVKSKSPTETTEEIRHVCFARNTSDCICSVDQLMNWEDKSLGEGGHAMPKHVSRSDTIYESSLLVTSHSKQEIRQTSVAATRNKQIVQKPLECQRKSKFVQNLFAYCTKPLIIQKSAAYKQPCECRVCHKTFVDSDYYELHWDRNHQEIDRLELYDNTVQCRICSQYLQSDAALRNHVVVVHDIQNDIEEAKVCFTCKHIKCTCSSVVSNNRNVNGHTAEQFQSDITNSEFEENLSELIATFGADLESKPAHNAMNVLASSKDLVTDLKPFEIIKLVPNLESFTDYKVDDLQTGHSINLDLSLNAATEIEKGDKSCKTAMKDEDKEKHLNTGWKCKYCDKMFSNLKSLHVHWIWRHKDRYSKKLFFCYVKETIEETISWDSASSIKSMLKVELAKCGYKFIV